VSDDKRKVVVRLRQVNGDPPFSHEGLWARPAGQGLWQIDNIPFYARNISNQDVVEVEQKEDGELRFVKVIRKGGHSTLRILFRNQFLARVPEIRASLQKLGCSSEVSNTPKLISVDVKPDADYPGVRRLLNDLRNQEVLAYEDGCLQHQIRKPKVQ